MHRASASLAVLPKIAPFKTAKISEYLRTLRGRNRARLVKVEDGRYFVQKLFGHANGSDRLFNEAFGSQLGAMLGLPFASWSELVGDWSGDRDSSFGSELISGEILECLPGNWYHNVQNRRDIFRCLLFDLWCNHVDPRQVVFQMRSPRVHHAYFVDHDQMFSADDEGPLFKRIAKTRYLDARIYNDPPVTIIRDLQDVAYDISSLTKYGLEAIEKSVPASWGSLAHRMQTVSGLRRRGGQLTLYCEAIMHFLSGLERPKTI